MIRGTYFTILIAGVCSFIASGKIPVTTYASDIKGQESIETVPDTSIGAKSLTGSWVTVTGIEGADYQEQLDLKLSFLKEVYQKKKEKFIIQESVSPEEAEKGLGIADLYEQSDLYRSLVAAGNDLTIAENLSFSISDDNQSKIYERYVFSLAEPADLSLHISYSLEKGKMAVWIIPSEGDAVYRNELLSEFDKTMTFDLEKGLYSIILVYELDNGSATGEQELLGTFHYHP